MQVAKNGSYKVQHSAGDSQNDLVLCGRVDLLLAVEQRVQAASLQELHDQRERLHAHTQQLHHIR